MIAFACGFVCAFFVLGGVIAARLMLSEAERRPLHRLNVTRDVVLAANRRVCGWERMTVAEKKTAREYPGHKSTSGSVAPCSRCAVVS